MSKYKKYFQEELREPQKRGFISQNLELLDGSKLDDR